MSKAGKKLLAAAQEALIAARCDHTWTEPAPATLECIEQGDSFRVLCKKCFCYITTVKPRNER